MKTKKKTYVLLALVLAVWGTVGYKIITALNPELPEIQPQTLVLNSDFKVKTIIDTFAIHTVNRDPFLGTIYREPTKKVLIKKQPRITWKQIDYQGFINQKEKKQRIFIISVNGQQYLYKKGQTNDSVTLVSGSSKRIKMRYKNHTKSFALKTD